MTLKGSRPVREGGLVSSASPTPGLLPHVGAQESWAHQDEDCRRRPLAFRKTGAKVPSARASCPRVDSCGAGEMRRNASWCYLTTEKDRRCEAGCPQRGKSGFKRGR